MVSITAAIPSPGSPSSLELEHDHSYFRPWASRSHHLTSSESVSPLTGPPPKRTDDFAQTRAIRSNRATLDVDYPLRTPTRPRLPDRSVTQPSRPVPQHVPPVSSALRPKFNARNSMTETAARYSDLINESSTYNETSVHRLPAQFTINRRESSLAGTIKGPVYSSRRWEHSNHWFKLGVGRQRPSLKRRGKTDSVVGTLTLEDPHSPPITFELTTISNAIPEVPEQEPPVHTPEQSLGVQQGCETQGNRNPRVRCLQRILHNKKQKSHFQEPKKMAPYVKIKDKEPGKQSFKQRTSSMLDKLTPSHNVSKKLQNDTTASSSTSHHGLGGHLKSLSSRASQDDDDDGDREHLLAATQPITSDDSEWYTSTANEMNRSVDTRRHDAPCFLPSEATRISTPPLPVDNSIGQVTRRNYFFDIFAPDGDTTNASPPSTKRTEASMNVRSSPNSLDPAWFRVKVGEEEDSSGGEVDYDIPDHLPSSPLCPRHPKHKSGGKGTCPMHGKNKSLSQGSSASG